MAIFDGGHNTFITVSNHTILNIYQWMFLIHAKFNYCLNLNHTINDSWKMQMPLSGNGCSIKYWKHFLTENIKWFTDYVSRLTTVSK